jgi:hypothetical protein
MKDVRTRVLKYIAALTAASVFPLLIVALGAGSAGAAAPAGYNAPFQLFVAEPDAVTSGSVQCASGTVAWGGGVYDVDSFSGVYVSQSKALSGGTGWSGSVSNENGSTDLFTVYALCADRPAGTFYQIETSAKVNNPPGTQTAARAVCPNGTRPLGGGVVTTGGLGVDLHNSHFSDPDGWYVAVNNISGDYDSIRAQVVCGANPFLRLSVVNSPVVTIQPNSFKTATATCSKIISGGVWSSDTNDLLSNVNSDYPFGSSWVATMSNASAHSITMYAEAVCAN